MRTMIAILLILCSSIPAFASGGIQTGATVTWKKGNDIFTGRLTGSSMEKKELTVILPSGKGVKLRLPDIRRITATGEKKKIMPSWSYTTSSYSIFRFETVDGKSVEGGLYEWPVFDIEVQGALQKNIWLDKLAFIEAGGTASSGGTGIQIGSRVRYVVRGDNFSGAISSIGLKEPVTVILPSGNSVKLELRNVRRIKNTGQSRRITPVWSSTATNYRLYEFETTDGKIITGGVYKNPVFDVDTGSTGMQKNIWLEHLEFIETE